MAGAPQFDPAAIVALYSAAMQTIQTWFQVRDSRQAQQAFDERFRSARVDSEVRLQAEDLAQIVPAHILEQMAARVFRCWESYGDVLKGGFLPSEVDEATESVQACLCRELKRIYGLNGSIPPGEMRKWWKEYCVNK